jgi:hypothetical protein
VDQKVHLKARTIRTAQNVDQPSLDTGPVKAAYHMQYPKLAAEHG